MSDSAHILVVEDDPALALGLVDSLHFEGYSVSRAGTGKEALALLNAHRMDCVLLDVMLPDMNGFDVCVAMREQSSVPILMLSARSQEADKVRGLDAGADDYITKPFSVAELIARIRAALRRTGTEKSDAPAAINVGDFCIDFQQQTIRRGDEVEQIQFYECEVLKVLAGSRGEPVSREELLRQVWGVVDAAPTRSIDNVIVRLRRKLEENPQSPRHILTAYGIGYKLAGNESE